MQQTHSNDQPSGAIAGAYAVAFLAATLVAVVGIGTTSILRAMDAWDDRQARKKKEARGAQPLRPSSSPAKRPVVKATVSPVSSKPATRKPGGPDVVPIHPNTEVPKT